MATGDSLTGTVHCSVCANEVRIVIEISMAPLLRRRRKSLVDIRVLAFRQVAEDHLPDCIVRRATTTITKGYARG